MRVGSLRYLVSIEDYTESDNDYGEEIKSWSRYVYAYARISPLSGTEKYISAEKHATATHQITIRYVSGVEPKMRIVFGERIFEIVSVINVGERDKMMQLIVTEEADK